MSFCHRDNRPRHAVLDLEYERSIKFGTLGSNKTGLRSVAFTLSNGLNNSNVTTLNVQAA